MSDIEIYQDKGGEWRWRLVASNGEIVADSAEGYTRKHDCERAVKRVAVILAEALAEHLKF